MGSEAQHDDVSQTLDALLQTPVGRRWLLKLGVNAATAAAVLRSVPAWAEERPEEAEDAAGSAAQAVGGVLRRFHFALGAAASLEDLHVVVNGVKVALTPHTRGTRRALTAWDGVWKRMDRQRLTHYAKVVVPPRRAVLLSVHGRRGGRSVVAAQALHAPRPAMRALALAAYALEGHFDSVSGSAERLRALGLSNPRLISAQEVVDLNQIVDSYGAAVALTYCHPNVATIDGPTAAVTGSLLSSTPEVTTLGTQIAQMQQSGQDYATMEPAVDASGNPSQIKIGNKTTGFSTVHLSSDPNFQSTLQTAVVAGVQGVRDTGSLGTVLNRPLDETPGNTSTWHQPEGIVPTSTPYTPPTGVGTAVQAQVQNTGLLYGTYTATNGDYAAGQVPLKLYNNYVRWVWVYVQYLKADGTNLSLNDNPTWPDTKYAKSLGLLPQVFTVLGVPLWDSNTIEVTLDFPPAATQARLLFCGLGNGAVDGGWRQYFPADAYPDHIAPQDEVLFPSLMTGLLTIGLTAFALLTDIDMAQTWGVIRELPVEGPEGVEHALVDLLTNFQTLTKLESFATLVAAGGATYEDIAANGGSATNIWNTLLSLGSVIPKVIFTPQLDPIWDEIAVSIVGAIAEDHVENAIPIFGEIMAVIMAVGDAATLAEAIGETASSPWVIANTVSLTYAATVTVSRDPRASTWPVTAVSWRIEAKIDGAVALNAQTGTINDGGKIQSDPIELSLNAPFGGNTIIWSIVLLDAGGNQVATGVSAPLANNDADNPPSSVSFAIVELPATISATTVFQRKDTTTYSEGAGGYTWDAAITDTGTLANSGIQEITGVTISTRLGVAGIVWKQNDQYWLRGVPIAENGNTIALGGATTQGYARRPFLLFDAFVGEGDVGNHVLLEPDDTEPGYHVRALSIDATTGALSWDPTTSLGEFLLPVSAAALHSSGRVVAIHTDSGRLGHVLPAGTPLPPQAAYSAGPGTEIGLLSSPTAVAVTNPGTILVLEAGASQLAAFDLNGNPVRYFGTATPAAFTLPLSASATYLDVAVDGAGQIYLLSYQGDGSAVADYRIDVYQPNGTPLATNSPGTNIPHLAVDYWRSIFAANYTPLLDSSTGQPRIDPALGVAEPSLSRFDPS
ncbi:NHL repeat-containing protein [Methylotetracoccus oryzae]|uniref:hypothetical protein n=1 Tax=Methylotetracoccus oryzae TaxID=1919059 RepID=UPI00111AE573|nr:hypothetical protein [Methylotetracoccus oryzae]